MKLVNALQAWGSGSFARTLEEEVERLPAGSLPLHKGVNEGGHVDDGNLDVTVIRVDDDDKVIQVRLGIFFTEIVANCSCGDEPMEKPAYCEMLLQVDKITADAVVSVIGD